MSNLAEMLPPLDHNQAPVTATVADNIVKELESKNADLIARQEALYTAMTRLPNTCENEETAKSLTTFGNQLKSCMDLLEERRKLEKRPYDEMASAVQGFFKGKIDKLSVAVLDVKSILKKYMDDQAAKQRLADEERRKAQAAESQKLVEQAQAMQSAGLVQSAERTLEKAVAVEQQASVVAAPVSTMVRGSAGGGASLTGKWKAEITDISTIDLEALRPFLDRDAVQKALNGFMKLETKQLGRDEDCKQLKGCKIYRDSTISLRG